MSIQVGGTNTSAVNNYTSTAVAETESKKEEEKKVEPETKKQQPESYKPDTDKINQMKSDMKSNNAAFKQMVYSMIKKQGGLSDIANLVIDKNTQLEAQAAIADDGEWGVEAVANRIVDFAKALSGGDPDKIETLKDSVKKGFEAAAKAWGGELPEISGKTYDRVMELFDEWGKEPAQNS